jgi:DNA-binding NarL/FixJ family response regulator
MLPSESPSQVIRVAALEDDAVLRDRYIELVFSAPDMQVLWTAATIAQARAALDTGTPDVLLVDLGLPDGSGLDIIRNVKQRDPGCEIMVVSVFGDEENVLAAIEAGASGYLLKDMLAEPFLAAIRELRAGGSPISPSIARILLTRSRHPPPDDSAASSEGIDLGDREAQILGLVAKGFNFGEIGRLLDISTNTVRTHIYRIYRKLAVHSRGEAVFEAKKLGLLDF